MHARVVLGVGKGVLFREVSSVEECPYIEREVPLYVWVRGQCYGCLLILTDTSVLKYR